MMITLIPRGALGHRMRLINRGMILADLLNRRLRIFWERPKNLIPCTFKALFQPLGHNIQVIDNQLWVFKERAMCAIMGRLPASMHRMRHVLLPAYDQVLSYRNSPVLTDEASLQQYAQSKHLLIRSFSFFATEHYTNLLSRFKPLPHLQAQIDRFANTLPPHTIGIHIRRTDNLVSIFHSKTELFIQAMRAAIEKQPDTHFYVASDQEAEKERLRALFGKRIITQTYSGRTTQEDIQQALIEMYILARTQKIIGSFSSHFSTAAAELGNIPLEIAKN